MADQFVLARIVNMRGVDLRRFEFDYDLTWAGLFFSAEGVSLGRFGGRDAVSADHYLTLPGLKYALRMALARNARSSKKPAAPLLADTADRVRRVEDYPAAQRLKANACIHCHQVYDFRRDLARRQNKFTREQIWVYPLPENLGFQVDPNQQNRVAAVRAAPKLLVPGLQIGDELLFIGQERIASYADIQQALHRAPAAGDVTIGWTRNGERHERTIRLAERWKETDISWRESMWGLEPAASVYGKDLSDDEKKALGLPRLSVAFRQGDFVPPAAAAAGIRKGDIILGIKGKELQMSMLQFNVYVRLNYQSGDKVTYEFIRNGKRLEATFPLPKRTF